MKSAVVVDGPMGFCNGLKERNWMSDFPQLNTLRMESIHFASQPAGSSIPAVTARGLLSRFQYAFTIHHYP